MHVSRADKKQQVRDRLMASALTLFKKKGVEPTTVQEIADHAQTSKGTFFNYFPTKESVVVAHYERLTEQAIAREHTRARAVSSEAKIRRLLCACANTVQDVELARALLRALFSSELVVAADHAIEQRLQRMLRDLLEEGIARGELRQNLELRVFLALLTGALSSSIQD